jgi:hypothetical protein
MTILAVFTTMEEEAEQPMRRPNTFYFATACGNAVLLLGLILSTGSLAQTTANSTCLSYEPSVVKLTGTLVSKTYPGPPNYNDIRRGDGAETSWFVNLTEPVCVNEDSKQPDLNPARKGVHTVQLTLSGEQYKKYKMLMGRKVVGTGTLFGEHTGHHYTPVLLTVSTLAAAE